MVINTHWWYGPYPKYLIAKINSFQINSSSKALQVAMTWIRFYLLLASDICRYCDREKKKKHVRTIMKLKFDLRIIKIILMILLNFWQCWTQNFWNCKAVADIKRIFLKISVTTKKPAAKFAYYFNKWSDTPFFYFTFSCFLSLFTLQLFFCFST